MSATKNGSAREVAKKKSKRVANTNQSPATKVFSGDRFRRNLLVIPLLALLVKFYFILRIPPVPWPSIDPTQYRLGNFWFGADGENYVNGLNALITNGVLTPEGYDYWPAGYPILLYIFGLPFRSLTLVSAAVIQTIIYAIAMAFFIDRIATTRLRRFAVPLALILAFNPTLSFNSYAIGYESPAAALLLLAVGLLIREFQKKKFGLVSKESILAALTISLTSFMQPRMVVIGIAIFGIWALATRTKKVALGFFAVTMAASLLLPAFLVARNAIATGQAYISTNLGVTMRIGAGPGATGGYGNGSSELICPQVDGSAADKDNAVVRCVVDWYLDNPGEAISLIMRKAVFYWSPWFGPVANGTMARNPWNQNHPLKSTAQNQQGYDLIFGTIGKVVSWLWLLSTIGFMLFGFWILWRANGLERLLGVTSLAVIMINMLVSMLTIGDHRFRLPVAGLSLFLQGVGLTWAFSKRARRSITGEEKLLWKSLTRTTNL